MNSRDRWRSTLPEERVNTNDYRTSRFSGDVKWVETDLGADDDAADTSVNLRCLAMT
jgi:hypothetical protein